MTVLRLTLSRTSTRPRWTVTSVPSQRSWTLQRVPRTVAAALRPLVRNEPLALPNRRRTRFFDFFFLAEIDAFALGLQVFLNDEPVSRSSVMSFLERFLIRDWRMVKRPRKNWPLCSFLALVSAALRTLTRPCAVSSVAPTGIVSAPSRR